MIDIHSHIIPNVDDGVEKIEESIKIIKESAENGFSAIFCTPHYIENGYMSPKAKNEELINELRDNIKKQGINIELYLGNEVYISSKIVELIKEGKCASLNNSRYILMELPVVSTVSYMEDVIFKIAANGYVPVIAHPERYLFVQKDYKKLIKLVEMGALFQLNYGSIVGIYGNTAKKTAKILLKNNLIHFLGTDTHKVNFIYKKIKKINKKICSIIGEEGLKKLSEINPNIIIEDGEYA